MSEYRGKHMKPAGGPARANGSADQPQGQASGRWSGSALNRGSASAGGSAPTGGAQGGSPRRPHRTPSRDRRLKLSLTLLAVVLTTAVTGATLAWFSETDALTNFFDRGKVKPAIEEQFEGNHTVKENVTVKNNGSMRSYMRATVSIYWEDAEGKQLWDAPAEGRDYTIVWGEIDDAVADPHWITGNDRFYYWSAPLDRDASTDPLIKSVTQGPGQAPEGCKLVVDVSSQAIQAEGSSEAFAYAWGDASGLVAQPNTGMLSKGEGA